MSTAGTVIPPERLEVYAEIEATFGNVHGLMTSIRQINADQAILEDEGRTVAARGAGRLLAGMVRRLIRHKGALPGGC